MASVPTASLQTVVHVTSFDADQVKADWANIKVVSVSRPAVPPPGTALVRITTRPLNPSDLIRAAGRYGPAQHPFVNGGEGLGVVEASASGAFTPGQRVVSAAWGAGTWQQYIAAPEEQMVAVPNELDDLTASQAWTNPVTVIGLLDVATVPRGEWLLHSAAGSVLGRMLVQYAAHLGIRTISVVRRKEQIAELRALGGDEVIDSSSEDVAARVKQITAGAGAWTALDAMMAALRPGGMVRVYGVLSGDTTTVGTIDMRANDKTLGGFILPAWIKRQGPGAGAARLKQALQLLADGIVKPLSGESFPLERVHDAIAAAQTPGRGGKVFLVG